MTEIRIRAIEPADYAAIALIRNATWPDFSVTAAELEARDARRRTMRIVRRRVAMRAGRIVGWSLMESDLAGMHVGTVQLWGAVLPSARGLGVGQALYADGRDALFKGGALRASIEVREHHEAARSFFESRGFEVVMRYAVSRLDLTRFRPEEHAKTLARVRAEGVEIISACALRAQRPDAIARINALRWQIAQDVPSPDPPVAESDASLAHYLDTQPTALPAGWLIARIGDAEIGLSTLWRSLADPTVVHTGVTGVLKTHRRRGIATALKVAAIEYARSIGARRIDTDNEEKNPMYALNLALGFAPQPAWLAYARDVNAAK